MSTQKAAHWQAKLAESRAALLSFLDQLVPEQWQTPVFSEGDTWSVATVVGHLVDSERGMSIHVYKIRKGEETLPEGFDLERWNAGVKKRIGDISPAELRAGLLAVRARTLEGLVTLADAEWSLTGRHPSRGVISVEQYYETIWGHEVGHLQDMQKALVQS